jgi:hypothetical protein
MITIKDLGALFASAPPFPSGGDERNCCSPRPVRPRRSGTHKGCPYVGWNVGSGPMCDAKQDGNQQGIPGTRRVKCYFTK